jgi:hypothetical protein
LSVLGTLSFLGFPGCRAQIKRFSRSERKRQRALCPIHTIGVENPVVAGALRLDGFCNVAAVGLAIVRDNCGAA